MKEFHISIEEPVNDRIDHFLATQNISHSRSQIARWIKKGWVLVNGKVARPSERLNLGDQIQISVDETPEPSAILPEKISLHILYEDEDLIVLNKSADMVVHPGAGHHTGTLTNALLAHCGKLSCIGGVERPGIVHRLDKGTSGVMVIAKNDKAHLELSRQFKDHEVTKIYWALVYGCPKEREGTIRSAIARSPSDRKKFTVRISQGKTAVTHYRVLQESPGLSLLEINLETGRTHQIRVHLTDKGHGLVGDPLYGGHGRRVKGISNMAIRGQLAVLDHPLLHSRTLKLIHPRTQKPMEWTAELPGDFALALTNIFTPRGK